jgi:hypothetical protein
LQLSPVSCVPIHLRASVTSAPRAYVLPLLCVDPATVRDVALAPRDGRDGGSPSGDDLKVKSTYAVTLPTGSSATSYWNVFTTEKGEVGLGGAADATPGPLARFNLSAPSTTDGPDLWSTVAMAGTAPGHSTLTLHAGPARHVVDVQVAR